MQTWLYQRAWCGSMNSSQQRHLGLAFAWYNASIAKSTAISRKSVQRTRSVVIVQENKTPETVLGKKVVKCSNCGKGLKTWDQSCSVRVAAKNRAIQNRTQDPGIFVVEEKSTRVQDDKWQIVGSRKKRDGFAGLYNNRSRWKCYRS